MRLIFGSEKIEKDTLSAILEYLDEVGIEPKKLNTATLEISIVINSIKRLPKIINAINFKIRSYYDVEVEIDFKPPFRLDVLMKGKASDVLVACEIFESNIKKHFNLKYLKESIKSDYLIYKSLFSGRGSPMDLGNSLLFNYLCTTNLIQSPGDIWSYLRGTPKKRVDHVMNTAFKDIYGITLRQVPDFIDLGGKLDLLELNPNELEKIVDKYRSLVYG